MGGVWGRVGGGRAGLRQNYFNKIAFYETIPYHFKLTYLNLHITIQREKITF